MGRRTAVKLARASESWRPKGHEATDEKPTRAREKRERRPIPKTGSASATPFANLPQTAKQFRIIRVENGVRSRCTSPSGDGVLVDRWPIVELTVANIVDRWGSGSFQARYLDARGSACGSSAVVTINEARKGAPEVALPSVITPEMYKLREMELRYMAEKQAMEMRHTMLGEQREFLERQLARAQPAAAITSQDVQRIVQESTQSAVQLARLTWENEQLKRGDGRRRKEDDEDDEDEDDDDPADERGMLASAERLMGQFARVMESPVAGPVLAPALASLLTKLAAAAPAGVAASAPPQSRPKPPPQQRPTRPAHEAPSPPEQPSDDDDDLSPYQDALPGVS